MTVVNRGSAPPKSTALQRWRSLSAGAFDEIENAHRAVSGGGPGRRHVTQQLNYAYVLLLAAHFQGYVRALHTEAAEALSRDLQTSQRSGLFFESLTFRRALDRQNASPRAIDDDFGRLGLAIWPSVEALAPQNEARRHRLANLIVWRNAIAHDDIDRRSSNGSLVPASVQLADCRRWRSTLNALTSALDHVVGEAHQLVQIDQTR